MAKVWNDGQGIEHSSSSSSSSRGIVSISIHLTSATSGGRAANKSSTRGSNAAVLAGSVDKGAAQAIRKMAEVGSGAAVHFVICHSGQEARQEK